MTNLARWIEKPDGRTQVLEAVIERLPIGVALLKLDGTPIIRNRAFRELHGIKDSEETLNFRTVGLFWAIG